MMFPWALALALHSDSVVDPPIGEPLELQRSIEPSLPVPPPEETAPVLPKGEKIEVTYGSVSYDAENEIAEFSKGVVATYGPTVLTADRLRLDYRTKTGRATGTVRVDDPEGSLKAHDFEFNWEERTGQAFQTEILVGRVSAKADSIRIVPVPGTDRNRWIIDGLFFTPSLAKKPDLAVSTKRVILETGRKGWIFRPNIHVFGKRVLQIPSSSFSLDKRVEGFRWPAISFQRKAGVGVSWGSGFLLSDQMALSAQVNSFPKVLPGTILAIAKSSVPPSKSTGFILPRSDMEERVRNGYLENIYVEDPAGEDEDIRVDRQTYALQTSWNQGSAGRLGNSTQISKRLELAGEWSGAKTGIGLWGQVRLQSLRTLNRDPWNERALFQGTAQSAPIRLLKGIELRTRADVFQTIGFDGDSFAWVRGSVSVIAQPHRYFRLGASYIRGKEWGQADYVLDRLFSKHAIHTRLDVNLGNYSFGLLHKYDIQRRYWYDTEWSFSFLAGSFQPYIQARLFPREFRLGFRLRAQDVFEKLTQRTQKRKS